MVTIQPYTLKNKEKRYRFKIYLGVDPLTGKEMSTTKSGFKTKTEAKDALTEIQNELRKGTYKKETAETYLDIYNIWVEHYENTVQDSTFLKTVRIFNNHILPQMSDYKIAKIHAAICQKHVNQWAKKLQRFRMVKNYAAKVLTFAMKRGLIDKNPFDLVEIPVLKKTVSFEDDEFENFYTREQLVEFLQCFEKEGNLKYLAFFHLLAFSGMRKSEALALTWRDIDFETFDISIKKAVARGKLGLYLGPTKNGLARTIKLDEKTIQLLKLWKKKQAEQYLEKDISTNKKAQLVFSNVDNELLDPNQTYKWINHILEKYKLEHITTHGLRHTHCSLLFEAGATIKEVQFRLGHKDVKTTLDIYAHVTNKAKSETVDKFLNYLNTGSSN